MLPKNTIHILSAVSGDLQIGDKVAGGEVVRFSHFGERSNSVAVHLRFPNGAMACFESKGGWKNV